MMRAMLSVALPAACGTMRRSARSGNCAKAACAVGAGERRDISCSGLELGAHLSALVALGMHVDVEVALSLQVRDLRA